MATRAKRHRPQSPKKDRDAVQAAPRAEQQTSDAKVVELPEQLTVRELADLMGVSPIKLIKQLMNAGVMANINQNLDHDTATIIAEDMGYEIAEPALPEPQVEEKEEAAPAPRRVYSEKELEDLRPRPPVVTILGHVDHGKTSLLDVIRETNVQAGEAGGITQHIGAYQIEVKGKQITFIDTPGHEAFTAMRARGAQATDIAVLVVAADNGVQPQTREAIDHARAAGVPIIVAINKIDLASANPDLVKQQLAELGLVPEDWGGDNIQVLVSARTQEGVKDLLDMILLVAELSELQANPKRAVEGVVLEGEMDRSRGVTATLLLQEGTLRVGDTLLVGTTFGRIRAMFDHRGKPVKRATPSTPVVVLGLRDVPDAGDKFEGVKDGRQARGLAEERRQKYAETATSRPPALTLEDIYAQVQAGEAQELVIILKVDAQGSIEPIRNSIDRLQVGEKDLGVKFIHEGVGSINESDVMLASASQAIIVGFNVTAEPAVERMAESEGVSIRTYRIIYRLIEDVQQALRGMLEPEYEQVVQGRAVVREVFHIPRVGNIAGVQIVEGKGLRNTMARVKRNNDTLYEGNVGSLRRFTEDVREVTTGMECGVGLDGFGDFEVDDIIEFYTEEIVE